MSELNQLSELKPLLEIREQMKRKKPSFIRQDAHKKRLKKRWVKPRGLNSKVRIRKKGHPCRVSIGYRFPKKIRGLSKEGLKVRVIHNKEELEKLDKEKEGAVIAANVSLKNKLLLLKTAKERGINILNLNADEYIKRKEELMKRSLEKKEEGGKEREKKKKERKEEKKEKLEERLTEEEKKEQEKREKEKLLIRRDV